jgi:hypothetical protein
MLMSRMHREADSLATRPTARVSMRRTVGITGRAGRVPEKGGRWVGMMSQRRRADTIEETVTRMATVAMGMERQKRAPGAREIVGDRMVRGKVAGVIVSETRGTETGTEDLLRRSPNGWMILHLRAPTMIYGQWVWLAIKRNSRSGRQL